MKYLIFLLLSTSIAVAQPNTEVYLFDLSNQIGVWQVTNPYNVSGQNKGYDNQPHFVNDIELMFTSTQNGQTDALLYKLESNELINLTKSIANEYSPTAMPDGKGFSCIYDSMQHLVAYDFKSGMRTVLVDNLVVGYHAWLSKNELALFVLGDTMTLQRYQLNEKSSVVLDHNIGRSLLNIPNDHAFSYLDKKTTPFSIKRVDIESGKISHLQQTTGEGEDIAWTPDGFIIMGSGSKLYATKPNGKWIEIANLSSFGLNGITRIAINPSGNKLAIVVEEQGL